MRRFPTEGKDSEDGSPIQTIMSDALGPILTLDSAPTTAGGQLPNHQDIGHVAGVIYINLNGTVYSITGTAV